MPPNSEVQNCVKWTLFIWVWNFKVNNNCINYLRKQHFKKHQPEKKVPKLCEGEIKGYTRDSQYTVIISVMN